MVGSTDIVLLKYSYVGTLQWTVQTGTGNNDMGHGVAVSPDNAYVYISGDSFGSLMGQPYAGLMFYMFIVC